MAGVDPGVYVRCTDPSPLNCVVSLNLHRRHLSESQRAIISAKLANIENGQVGGGHDRQAGKFAGLVDQPTAARMLNVSERSLRTAKEILKASPELAEEVEAGEKSLHRAQKEVRRASPAQEEDEMPHVRTADEEMQPHVPISKSEHATGHWYRKAKPSARARFIEAYVLDCEILVNDKDGFKRRLDSWFDRCVRLEGNV
jgi:hypothetical protein